MRKITPESFDVYTLDELSPEARLKAINNVTNLLAGDWWDSFDTGSVGDAIVYAFAGQLRSSGWDTYGEGDFPGIDGVHLSSWDLDRGEAVAFDGVLTRDNAPALPWTDDIHAVHLQSAPHGGHTYIGVAAEDVEGELPGSVRTMQDAVTEAMFAAKRAGRAQLQYLTSNQRAEDDILLNEREFTADGQLYQG